MKRIPYNMGNLTVARGHGSSNLPSNYDPSLGGSPPPKMEKQVCFKMIFAKLSPSPSLAGLS